MIESVWIDTLLMSLIYKDIIMSLKAYAGMAANAADKLTYVSRKRVVEGQEVYIVPCGEAEQMKADLVKISHLLNDLQDERDAASS